MRSIRCILSEPIFLALLLVCVAMPLGAQSLGDVAKKEAERRKSVKEPEKVLTNKDVPHLPQADQAPPAPSSGDADAAAEKGDAVAPDKPGPAEPASEKPADVPKDEKYWSERYKAVQQQLERDQVFLEALQTRVNALTTDFVNRDDPAQRATIGSDRQKALAEVTRLNATILADKKAIADFEDEARRAAVPPGWLR
jgi:hypothetical protein